jgi:hypothetical protein
MKYGLKDDVIEKVQAVFARSHTRAWRGPTGKLSLAPHPLHRYIHTKYDRL